MEKQPVILKIYNNSGVVRAFVHNNAQALYKHVVNQLRQLQYTPTTVLKAKQFTANLLTGSQKQHLRAGFHSVVDVLNYPARKPFVAITINFNTQTLSTPTCSMAFSGLKYIIF